MTTVDWFESCSIQRLGGSTPAWRASDVAAAIGLKGDGAVSMLMSRHSGDFIEGIDYSHNLGEYSKRRGRPALWLTQSGVLMFCLLSRAPKAAAFRRWLVSEGTPSILATGGYGPPRETLDAHIKRIVADAVRDALPPQQLTRLTQLTLFGQADPPTQKSPPADAVNVLDAVAGFAGQRALSSALYEAYVKSTTDNGGVPLGRCSWAKAMLSAGATPTRLGHQGARGWTVPLRRAS